MRLSTGLIALAAVFNGVIASPAAERRDAELAVRSEGAVAKRGAYTNARFTWYPNDTGADACTGRNHNDNDFVVALNKPLFGSSGNGHCGKQIRITHNGKTAVATIADECWTCYSDSDIDLTPGLFKYFGEDLGQGTFYATWEFVDGSGGPPPPPPPPPKPKPKPSAKPTPSPPAQSLVKPPPKPISTSLSVSKVSISLPAGPTIEPPPPVNAASAYDAPVNAAPAPSDALSGIQGGIGNNGPLPGAATSTTFSAASILVAALAGLAVQLL